MNESALAHTPIREARQDDADQLADILTEAFTDDPVMRWTFGSPKPFRPIFTQLAKGLYLRNGFGHIAGDLAATLWLPAGETVKLPFAHELRIVVSALRHSGVNAIRRGLNTSAAMAKNHPHTPHYYLFSVGVRKAGQGKGLGGRIIRKGLQKADDAGAAAYLENSNPMNTPLYERLGFRITGNVPLPSDAPPLLSMLRPVGD